LKTGTNLIGYNALKPILASDLVGCSVPGYTKTGMVQGCTVKMISYFDEETGKYYSYFPKVNKPGSVYDFTITPGRAYFIEVTGPGKIVYQGVV